MKSLAKQMEENVKSKEEIYREWQTLLSSGQLSFKNLSRNETLRMLEYLTRKSLIEQRKR
jgi:hypothetical protein